MKTDKEMRTSYKREYLGTGVRGKYYDAYNGELKMKKIVLEVEDSHYQTLLDVIKALSNNHYCRVLEDNDDTLTKEEYQQIQNDITKIKQGDYSDFEDWEVVKTKL